jgi:hypothetical protein
MIVRLDRAARLDLTIERFERLDVSRNREIANLSRDHCQ